MPKYYCDYCDIFLTHDSASVRKAHNSGWKHISMVREYYSELGQDKTQAVIDQITRAYSGTGFNPMMGPIHPMIRPVGGPPGGYGRPPPSMAGGGGAGGYAPSQSAPPPPHHPQHHGNYRGSSGNYSNYDQPPPSRNDQRYSRDYHH